MLFFLDNVFRGDLYDAESKWTCWLWAKEFIVLEGIKLFVDQIHTLENIDRSYTIRHVVF